LYLFICVYKSACVLFLFMSDTHMHIRIYEYT
jgi:hypothetical protein